jgi:phosphatidylinositol dimannoside acyltransferase
MKLLIKKMMLLLMWYPLRMTITLLPLRILSIIGTVGGYLLYLVSRDRHKIMVEEFRRIMPEKHTSELHEIAMRSFVNYSLSELEVLLYPSLNTRYIKKHYTIEGRKHLDEALSKGRGVILFQAHFGAFQMVMPAIGYSGYKMNQISASAALWKDVSISHLQKKTYDIKARYEYTLPVNHISIKSSLRPVFSALERNEIVGITVDGGGGKKIVSIRFLGRDANFQRGAANLAMRTEAEIVPAFIITESSLRHRLILHQPIKVMRTNEKDKSINQVLNEFARILESYIYKYPSHYGYTLYLRRSRASLDSYPFFQDYELPQDRTLNNKAGRGDYA